MSEGTQRQARLMQHHAAAAMLHHTESARVGCAGWLGAGTNDVIKRDVRALEGEGCQPAQPNLSVAANPTLGEELEA